MRLSLYILVYTLFKLHFITLIPYTHIITYYNIFTYSSNNKLYKLYKIIFYYI